MKTDLPTTFNQSVYDLEPAALMEFFVLTLRDGTIIPFSSYPDFTYRGTVYSQIGCTLSPSSIDANGRQNRPRFTFVNPEGLFTHAVGKGLLEEAVLTHREALVMDVMADSEFFIERTLVITRVMSVSRFMVATEMRDIMDRHDFVVPSRAFYPPEFPHVRLQ